MEIQMIKDGVLAAFVSHDELTERGLSDGRFNSESAHDIAREALFESGERNIGEIEVDAYINGCGLMLFAAVRKEGKSAVKFSSLEALLSYVACLPRDTESRLVLLDGEYCLISPCLSQKAREYGEVCRCTEDIMCAAPLIKKQAVAQLYNYFHL